MINHLSYPYKSMFILKQIVLGFFLLFLFFILTSADNPETCQSTLLIKKRGKLIVGTYNDDPYFSYLNPKTYQLQGFDIDLAHAITHEMLGDKSKVEFIIINASNRISYLQERKVDLILAEMTINKERQQLVDFSDIYYMAGQSLLVKNDQPFHSLNDLENKNIGVISDSTNVDSVKHALPKAEIHLFNSLSSGFQALAQDQIQALCIDDVLLFALKGEDNNYIEGYRFVGGEISWEPYGIAVKRGCKDLLRNVNKILQKIKDDGRWQQIYDKNIKQVSNISARPPS